MQKKCEHRFLNNDTRLIKTKVQFRNVVAMHDGKKSEITVRHNRQDAYTPNELSTFEICSTVVLR